LLIGGQACIIYGAAEFSRDSDFAIIGNSKNLKRLKNSLKDLKAERVYVPPLELKYLKKGHACHFRCKRKDVRNLRVDIIAKMRGCDTFARMWKRRNVITLRSKKTIDVLGIEDLVQSKKTQRDKDWFMLRRLVNNDIILHRKKASEKKISWWFRECMDADILTNLTNEYPAVAKKCVRLRHLLKFAIASQKKKLDREIKKEENFQRKEDRRYWKPLLKELETLRHSSLT